METVLTLQSFDITAPNAALDDLRRRVVNSRFVDASRGDPWGGGADPAYLRRLAERWTHGFPWRAIEAKLTRHAHFRTVVRGAYLHYVHLRGGAGRTSSTLPVVLLHGWPSSFVEMLPLAERLSDPARFGGDPRLARDVVVPSLPGFLFSDLPAEPATRQNAAASVAELMRRLGYERYAVFGSDIGGVIAGWLGAEHARAVAGIHLIHPPFPATFDDPLTDDEKRYLDRDAEYDQTDGGYSAIMGTRPDTIGAALVDSPIGLAAWIADKWRDWSDCGGDLERRFTLDDVLTVATLYWTTRSIGTSMRQYADWDANPLRPRIKSPVAVTLATEPSMAGFPRSLAERATDRIVHWSEPGSGGHFLAYEETALMFSELQLSMACFERS